MIVLSATKGSSVRPWELIAILKFVKTKEKHIKPIKVLQAPFLLEKTWKRLKTRAFVRCRPRLKSEPNDISFHLVTNRDSN